MKGAVSQEEFTRFMELYRRFAGPDTALKANAPDALKGLSAIDISIANIVSSQPDITVGEIAQMINAPNSTLTSALNRLEKKGIVQRVPNLLDRRSFGIRLTNRGEKLQQLHLSSQQSKYERVLAKLDTHEEREMLFYLLGKMIGSDRKTGSAGD